MTDDPMTPSPRPMRRWEALGVNAGRVALAGAIAGAMAGLVWGGIGGRLAMRLVFLTSGPGVAGLDSDDGFTIGRFSLGETVFLVVVATVIGAVVGPLAAMLRRAMRSDTRTAAISFAIASGAFLGGNDLIHSDGIDFRLLGPLALTVGLFVLIPAGAAFTAVFALDHLLRPGGRMARLPSWLLLASAGLATAPVIGLGIAAVSSTIGLLLVVGALGAGFAMAKITGAEGPARISTALHWGACGILGGMTLIGIAELAEDLAALT